MAKIAIEYFKHLTPINEFKKRTRLDVLVIDSSITVTEVRENHKDNSEVCFTVCRSYFVKNVDELRYLFLRNNNSAYWLLIFK